MTKTMMSLIFTLLCVQNLVGLTNIEIRNDAPMDSNTTINPPNPVAPCNVTKVGLPKSTNGYYYNSGIQDYVALKVTCTKAATATTNRITCLGGSNPRRGYNESQDILFNSESTSNMCYSSAYCIGFRDLQGVVYTVYDFVCKSDGYIPGFIMLNPAYYSRSLTGSYIKDIDSWSLVYQENVPANKQGELTYVAYGGLSRQESPNLSDSVGIKTATSWTTDFDMYRNQMSSRLSTVFNHKITIDTFETTYATAYFPPTPTEQVVGVYQLQRWFSPYYSSAFLAAVDKQNTKNQGSCSTASQCNCVYLYETYTFVYSDNQFLTMSAVDKPCH